MTRSVSVDSDIQILSGPPMLAISTSSANSPYDADRAEPAMSPITGNVISLEITPERSDIPSSVYHANANTTIRVGRKMEHQESGPLEYLTTCPVVSRKHAEFRFVETKCLTSVYIVDLGSHHGTFLNERPIIPGTMHQLESGDIVIFGKPVVKERQPHSPHSVKIHLNYGAPRKPSGQYGLVSDNEFEAITPQSVSLSSIPEASLIAAKLQAQADHMNRIHTEISRIKSKKVKASSDVERKNMKKAFTIRLDELATEIRLLQEQRRAEKEQASNTADATNEKGVSEEKFQSLQSQFNVMERSLQEQLDAVQVAISALSNDLKGFKTATDTEVQKIAGQLDTFIERKRKRGDDSDDEEYIFDTPPTKRPRNTAMKTLAYAVAGGALVWTGLAMI